MVDDDDERVNRRTSVPNELFTVKLEEEEDDDEEVELAELEDVMELTFGEGEVDDDEDGDDDDAELVVVEFESLLEDEDIQGGVVLLHESLNGTEGG